MMTYSFSSATSLLKKLDLRRGRLPRFDVGRFCQGTICHQNGCLKMAEQHHA